MISVLIPVFDGAHILPITIPAVRALEGVDEILWIDDGSTDATPELLSEAGRTDPRVRIVTLPSNQGRSAARNAGVDASAGEILVFLDADVEPVADSGHRLARAAAMPGAVAAVARIKPVATDPMEPYQDYAVHARRGPDPAMAAESPVDWRYFLAGASAVQRRALIDAGGFPEDIPYGEDQALACMLSKAHPEGLGLASTTVWLHDVGDLDRAIQNARAYGGALRSLRGQCSSVMPRTLDMAVAVGWLARPIASVLSTVIARTPSSSLRRRLVRYLLASHAIHAASHASPPATPLGSRDRL
ncbi:glycosyltransferase family 2 protein [Rubrivirga sp. IMCC43871]|uniref:glycosyltransferase family 2 protein n=1 Tax=Rubrivirga sp. IMCC43871 TaxID=3391575 RepID=UPI0039901431